MGSRDRDSTQSLIADAEELIKNKNAGKKDGPQATRELLAGAEKLVKNKPAGAPEAKKGGALVWALVAAAVAAAVGLYLMK
jgi:hypothetical protein